MALINCPDCGNETSDQAVACKKCGYPISKFSSIPKEKDKPQSENPRTVENTKTFTEEDYYYQQEFEEIQKSKEVYKGRWNWYAFLFTWIWCFYKGCNSIGIAILLALYLITNSGLRIFGFHGIELLPFWLLLTSIIMGINGTWYLYNLKVKNKKISDLFIMFIAKTIYNKSLKRVLVVGLILIIPVSFLVYYLNQKEDRKRDEWRNELKPLNNKEDKLQTDNSNVCSICNRTFKGKGYEEVSDGVWKECQEPYQCYICSKACGLKHTSKMNNLVNETKNNYDNNSNSYHKGSDGKLYENNACSLCKGTGIEKNTSSMSDEYGRKCPMCDGKGVRNY